MAPLQNKVTHVVIVTAFWGERGLKAAVNSNVGNFGEMCWGFEKRIKLTKWPSTFRALFRVLLETLRGE